ncbi:MAG TPA: IS1 family transposase, partial [Terriglobia bacterium]|nr:IS1 family transposase [Terriglobia bacterium]
NLLPLEKQIQIANALVEGNSIRSTSRLVGVEHKTVMRVLLRIGDACGQLLNEHVRRIRAKRVQVDEIWTYVFKKQKNLGYADDEATMGDQYVFVAMDSESKLVISHLVGKRDYPTAFNLIADLKGRLAHRIQLTTDGFRPYINAVEDNFGADIDYGVLVKMYGGDREETAGPAWYGPAKIVSTMPTRVTGDPDWKHISTSHIERQNLTMRMSMRRFTRLTNAASKKLANLKAQVALHFAHYNFCRVHYSLRVTPAMEAGLSFSPWTIRDLLTANLRRAA